MSGLYILLFCEQRGAATGCAPLGWARASPLSSSSRKFLPIVDRAWGHVVFFAAVRCEGWVQGGREGAGEMGSGEKAAPSTTPAAPASLLSTDTVCRSSALAQMTRRVAARGSGAGMGGGGHANNPAFMFGADYAKNKWKPALFVGTCTAVVQHGQKCPLGSAPNAAPAAS